MPRKRAGDPPAQRNETILQRSMEEIMHDSMLPYAQHVIMERALPRVEDGLKPVQRRILFAMHELGMTPDKPFKKSARIVGEVLGKYHPHGDTSVYDAMVRLAQPFNMRGLLVEGHGNFGSVDGDGAAAMRYTEARMAPLALELLRDLEKDTVNFVLNFDDSLREPEMLPGRFPNLLVNGASGIAVGLATNIPPHNLGESIEAALAVMDNPEIPLPELMGQLPAPDFPTGGLLVQNEEIQKAYETGRGRLTLRAKVEIEPVPGGKTNLVVTELPYQVNKAALLEKILKTAEEKKGLLSFISDIRDESDRTGMRAVIELKKDADPQRVLAQLYKVSDLQVSFGVNMVAIADGKPLQLGLKALLQRYVDYQKKVVSRRCRYDLDRASQRAHVLEGLIRAVDILDAIIALIRASKAPKEAKQGLMERFSFTDAQAQAILDMRLQRLTGLEILALRREFSDLSKEIKRLEGVLASDKKLRALIRSEMLEIKQRFADPRRTRLIADEQPPKEWLQPLRAPEPCVVLQTAAGFLKCMAPKAFQRAEDTQDPPVRVLQADAADSLLLITSRGLCHTLEASQIPEARWKDRGLALAGLLPGVEGDERLVALLNKASLPESLLFVTALGQVKRSPSAEFGQRKGRASAINLKDGDALLFAEPCRPAGQLLLCSGRGMAILFDRQEVSLLGRAAAGVRGMALDAGDRLVFAAQCDQEGELLLVSDRGYGKRLLLVDLEPQRRGGKGARVFPFNKNGSNGQWLQACCLVKQPFAFRLVQRDGSATSLSTEQVPIRTKADRGAVLCPVFLDNTLVSLQKEDVPKSTEKED